MADSTGAIADWLEEGLATRFGLCVASVSTPRSKPTAAVAIGLSTSSAVGKGPGTVEASMPGSVGSPADATSGSAGRDASVGALALVGISVAVSVGVGAIGLSITMDVADAMGPDLLVERAKTVSPVCCLFVGKVVAVPNGVLRGSGAASPSCVSVGSGAKAASSKGAANVGSTSPPGTYSRWFTKMVSVFRQFTCIRVGTSVP
jgi:hypothetical protein